MRVSGVQKDEENHWENHWLCDRSFWSMYVVSVFFQLFHEYYSGPLGI